MHFNRLPTWELITEMRQSLFWINIMSEHKRPGFVGKGMSTYKNNREQYVIPWFKDTPIVRYTIDLFNNSFWIALTV